MPRTQDKSARQLRFMIEDLQTRIRVLENVRADLIRQINKLTESVPEEQVDIHKQKEGYVSYGTYAQSVIERKQNLRTSLKAISVQSEDLSVVLQNHLEQLQSHERLQPQNKVLKHQFGSLKKKMTG